MIASGRAENAARSLGVIRRTFGNFGAWHAPLVHGPRGRPPRQAARLRMVAMIAGAVVVILAAMFALDAAAIAYQRGLPPWLRPIAQQVSDFGRSGWFLIPTGAAVVVLAASASDRIGRFAYLTMAAITVRLSFVFLAIGLPGLVVTIGKRLIGRARPRYLELMGPVEFFPFSWRPDFASLPSGHSTTAFAAAIAVGSLFPRSRPFIWTYAVLVALSRVALGAHYPSDVVAGIFVGASGALLVRYWFATRRLAFTIGLDGAPKARPGPSLHRIKRVAGRLLGQ